MIVNTWSGDPLTFHALDPVDLMLSSDQVSVWVVEPDRPAVALGSAQRRLLPSAAAADAGAEAVPVVRSDRGSDQGRAAGSVVIEELAGEGAVDRVELAVGSRRSGGGAVLIDPGRCTWLDVLLPAGNRNWDADVIRSGRTIGRLLAAAVNTALGRDCDVVQSSAMDLLGTEVCFAGLGPGEVLIDGRKLIGVSQRRVRAGARFQVIWYSEHRTRTLLNAIGALSGAGGPPGSKFLSFGHRSFDEVAFEVDQRLTTITDPSGVLRDCFLGELDRLDGSEHLRG